MKECRATILWPQFLSGQLASTVINMVMLLFYLILMLCYDWKLALVGVVAAAINMGYLKYIAKRRESQNAKLQQDSGRMMGTAMGGLQIIETLKASGSEGDFFAKCHWLPCEERCPAAGIRSLLSIFEYIACCADSPY